MELGNKRVGIVWLAERGIVRTTLRVKVRRQIVVGVSEAGGTDDPHFFTAQLFPQGLEHAEFIIDAVDAFHALLVPFHHQIAPHRPDHPINLRCGDVLAEAPLEGLTMADERDVQNGTVAQQIALWADKLRDISALGLQFSQNIYDHERYLAIQNMAMDMLALVTAQPRAQMEPLREPIFSRPTPIVAGNGAVINDNGHILLLRRADNHLWTMPRGGMEVGETPAEGVVREVLEETGVRCEPIALVGIYDSRRWDISPLGQGQHIYKFTFLCKPLDDGAAHGTASHTVETLDVAWFAEGALPEGLYEGHRPRIRDSFRIWRGAGQAHFDPR